MKSHLALSAFILLILAWGCSTAPPTIALLTDYGWDDPYVGALQGVILSINPKAQVVHISHQVPSYDIREGSYLLITAAKDFPPRTVFVAVVDPGVGSERRPIIIETLDKKFFVGPDNGLFTDVIHNLGVKRAVEISNILWYRTSTISSTFHGRDIFGPAAARLAAGKSMEDAGAPISNPTVFKRSEPAFSKEQGIIRGEILHRDHYGNLITNLTAPLLAKVGWRAGMTLEFNVGLNTIQAKFGERYGAVPKGDFVMLLNSQGLLEIARNLETAADSLGAVAGDTIIVRTAGTTPTTTP